MGTESYIRNFLLKFFNNFKFFFHPLHLYNQLLPCITSPFAKRACTSPIMPINLPFA